jgi:hypothetical protein
MVTTSTRAGLIDDLVISIVVFLVLCISNIDGTGIQWANSMTDTSSNNLIKARSATLIN